MTEDKTLRAFCERALPASTAGMPTSATNLERIVRTKEEPLKPNGEPKPPPSSSNPDEQKPGKPSVPRLLPEKLTPSEIEALRQDAKELIAFARKAFKKKP